MLWPIQVPARYATAEKRYADDIMIVLAFFTFAANARSCLTTITTPATVLSSLVL